MSETYQAWDNNDYPWPPPEGWYQAPGGLWWPQGYGPGPTPEAAPEPFVVAEIPVEQTTLATPAVVSPPPAAATFVPEPTLVEPAPLDVVAPPPPAVIPPQNSIPAPVETPPPGYIAPSAAPAPGAPSVESAGYNAPGYAPPGSMAPGGAMEEASGSGSKKALAAVGGLCLLGILGIAGFFLYSRSSGEEIAGGTTTVPVVDGSESPVTTQIPRDPAPLPGTGPGSLGEPWAIDDSVAVFYQDFSLDGEEVRWTIQATGVAVDATQQVLAENQFNEPPPSGETFVLVPIRLTYKSGPGPVTASDLQFKAVGSSGRVSSEYHDFCGVFPSDFPEATTLNPGDVLEGNLCWAVPTEDIGSLKLIVQVVIAQGAVYIDVSP